MSHSNSKITPPIDLIGDVDYTLGLSTGDVKKACMGGTTDPCKINMWSKYKPLRGGTYYTDILSGNNWKSEVDTTYNCGIIYNPESITNIINQYTTSTFTNFFSYNHLTTNDWGRLTDFNGYYHLAKSPFGEYFEISAGASRVGTTNEYNSIKGKLITFTLHNTLGFSAADNVHIQDLGRNKGTSYTIGNWYFGVAASNNGVYARSNVPVVGNNTYSYSLVLDTSDVDSTLGLNLSTTFYPILHASKGTDGTDGPEGLGVIYPLKVSRYTTTTTTETIGLDNVSKTKMNPVILNLVPAIKLETNQLTGLLDTTKVKFRGDPYNTIHYKLSFKNYLTSSDVKPNTKPLFTDVAIYVHYREETGDWWDETNHRPSSTATLIQYDTRSTFQMSLASDYNHPTIYTTPTQTQTDLYVYFGISRQWEGNLDCRIVAKCTYDNADTGIPTIIWIDEPVYIQPY